MRPTTGRRRRWGWRLGAALAAVGLLAAAAVALSPELRTFALLAVAPARARDGLLVRLRPPAGPPVVILGTIHGAHLDTPSYGLRHLEAVVRHLAPGRLLVESRPEELDAGHLGDGPIEMGYAALVARELGVPVGGVDWWSAQKIGPRRTDDERDDRIAAAVLARLDPARPTLVLVGYSHLAELAGRLATRGYEDAPFTAEEKARLFDPAGLSDAYPAGMAAAVEDRIARDEASLAQAPAPELAARLRDAVAARRRFLDRIRAAGERPTGR